MPEKFQPRANVPEIIALQFAKGKEVESSYNGTEVLYTLQDGRAWYVKPFIAAKIDALELGKGEPFQVTKFEAANGKGFHYEIEHVTTQPRQAAVQAPVRQSVASTQPNGTAVGQVVFQPTQQNTSAAPQHAATQRMMAAFSVAIDAIAEAQAYANRKSLGITFTSENLTSAALTVFINACKEGR